MILSKPDPDRLPWKEYDIDCVVESSGQFRRVNELERHLDAGAR
ncbi:MAG: hypothetical protein CNE99_03520 [OM182 bacterium MED-G24]|uniref:Uncharacterized protein n=1 Tax=OM182 bacterium MED-G24 TaxID=1986255 RepID=A0A2A5WWQ5_9GAMM|nr:MAG: hypothetical protein CNE99_03520 [OM182 bacterium MED-G24]